MPGNKEPRTEDAGKQRTKNRRCQDPKKDQKAKVKKCTNFKFKNLLRNIVNLKG
jgi:hypothetical protein